MSFLLKYGDDFSMEYSCPHKRVTPGFTMDFFMLSIPSARLFHMTVYAKKREERKVVLRHIIFFRSSEFSPHVNTGSKISLFQSFNSYVVAKCKFNVGVFRYLTSMFPWSWTILKGRILSTSNFLSSSSALVRSDVGRFWEWAWLAPPCIKFLIRFFTLSGRFGHSSRCDLGPKIM